ncbi:MAG: hypothetical protein KIT09_15135 [Bryobacteraceae bacterium]|nr:hypothetical protein [Bryobacteraceae bacterium]
MRERAAPPAEGQGSGRTTPVATADEASLRRQRLALRGLWAATCAGVIVGSLLPATSTPLELIGEYLSDKVIHLLSYGWLAFLPMLREKRSTAAVSAVGVLAMGFLLELAQGLTPDRDFDMYDFAANAAGVAGGVGLGLSAQALGRRSAHGRGGLW